MLQVFYPSQAAANCPMLTAPFPDSIRKKFPGGFYHHCIDAPPLQSDTTFPIIIFSPGFGGSYLNSVSLAEELASHGYVVMYLGHPYFNDLPTFNDGKEIKAFSMDTLKMPGGVFDDKVKEMLGKYFRIEARDILSLVPALQHNIILREIKMDVKNIAVIGYSGGGAAGMIAASKDPADIKAVFNLDGILYGFSASDSLKVPVFYLHSDLDYREAEYTAMNGGPDVYNKIIAYYKSQDSLAQQNSSSDYYELSIPHSLHTDFSDEAFVYEDSIRVKMIYGFKKSIAKYSVEFFDKYLRGTDSLSGKLNAGKEGKDPVLRKKR